MKTLHRWRWSIIRWFRYFFHLFYSKVCLFENLSSILVNLLFSKLNNILQVLQSISIVWCFDQFKIKVFWNGNSLITGNIFFYLHPHRVCSLYLWDHFYSFFLMSLFWKLSATQVWKGFPSMKILILNGILKSLSNSSKKHEKDISGVYYRCRWPGLRPFCSQLLATMGWKQFWK